MKWKNVKQTIKPTYNHFVLKAIFMMKIWNNVIYATIHVILVKAPYMINADCVNLGELRELGCVFVKIVNRKTKLILFIFN